MTSIDTHSRPSTILDALCTINSTLRRIAYALEALKQTEAK